MGSEQELRDFPKVVSHLEESRERKKALFSVKTALDLIMTCVNIMMDANLLLQIQQATMKKGFLEASGGLSALAPEVLTLCGGRLDPFDFNLSKDQHYELFLSGQLSVHLHSCFVDGRQQCQQALSVKDKLKSLLYCLHLGYPT